MDLTAPLAALAALIVGVLIGWLLGGRAVGRAREALARREAELDAERARAGERLALLEQATARMRDSFQALAADALRNNQQSFLELARASLGAFQEGARGDLDARQKAIEALVKPVAESLEKVDAKLQNVEKERVGAYSALTEQVRSLATGQIRLQSETANLVRALRTPSARGKWGEVQLRRVVEMAGMVEHCDFLEQQSADGNEGRLRPDLIVRLPGGKNVVVDAKAPLAAYLEAVESEDDETQAAKLRDHARQVRDHMTKLGTKGYQRQFEPAPEFVVMFLPGESFFGAALQHDPALIEFGVDQGVIPASPTTLIALLRAVAYGWRQERIAESAREISELGRALHERLRTMADHLARVGKGLNDSVAAFNQAVGSFETRVLVAARRFKGLGAGVGDEIREVSPVERAARAIDAADEDGAPH